MKAFRIAQWNEAHETHESRKLKYLAWTAAPNKHDGLGFSYLKIQDDRVELYCAFKLLVDLASRAPKEERGWIVRGGKALRPVDLALMTGFPEPIFAKAFAFFTRPEIGWLEEQELPARTPDLKNLPPTSPEPPAASAGTPGGSPEPPAASAGTPGGSPEPPAASGKSSPTDQTDPGDQTDPTDRQTKDRSSSSIAVPSLKEVQDWAASAGLPTDYAAEKHAELTEKRGWIANGKLVPWQSRWKRFWKEDEAKWLQKNATPQKQPGDADFWWTGERDELEAALRGALLGQNEKNAGRLREIISVRFGSRAG